MIVTVSCYWFLVPVPRFLILCAYLVLVVCIGMCGCMVVSLVDYSDGVWLSVFGVCGLGIPDKLFSHKRLT